MWLIGQLMRLGSCLRHGSELVSPSLLLLCRRWAGVAQVLGSSFLLWRVTQCSAHPHLGNTQCYMYCIKINNNSISCFDYSVSFADNRCSWVGIPGNRKPLIPVYSRSTAACIVTVLIFWHREEACATLYSRLIGILRIYWWGSDCIAQPCLQDGSCVSPVHLAHSPLENTIIVQSLTALLLLVLNTFTIPLCC